MDDTIKRANALSVALASAPPEELARRLQRVGAELGYSSHWSVPHVQATNLPERHGFGLIKRVSFHTPYLDDRTCDKEWLQVRATCETWFDLWAAADKLIKRCGTRKYKIILGFEPDSNFGFVLDTNWSTR